MRLLDATDISRACGVSRPTLYALMARFGRPEPAYTNGKLTIYQPDAVMVWLETVHGGKYADRFQEALRGR